jgi:hypothetical protein
MRQESEHMYCPATCAQVIAYLQQFNPDDYVYIGGRSMMITPAQEADDHSAAVGH